MGLSVKPKELIKFLEENGYTFIRANGTSHHIYGKNGKSVPIPVHKGRDLNPNTTVSIIKQCGFTKDDFLKWLGR